MSHFRFAGLFLLLIWTPFAAADERLQAAQSVLKAQGYYFGPVDGRASEETEQSLRRFQIRNLLPVTGNLDDGTAKVLDALGSVQKRLPAGTTARRPELPFGPATPAAPTAPTAPNPPPPAAPKAGPVVAGAAVEPRAPVPIQGGAAATVPTPAPTPPPAAARPPVIQATIPPAAPVQDPAPPPNSTAPTEPYPGDREREVQPESGPPRASAREALARAQERLQQEGWYQGRIDGRPGSRTRSALREFQLASAIPPTGRLDGVTMHALGLDPNDFVQPETQETRRARYRRGGVRIFGLRLGWR